MVARRHRTETAGFHTENAEFAALTASADGAVFSWGSNRAGTLGHGDTVDRLAPEAIAGVDLYGLVRR